MTTELRTLAERNKSSLGELDRVDSDLAQVNSRVEELVEGSSERGQMSTMKTRIIEIKDQIHQM